MKKLLYDCAYLICELQRAHNGMRAPGDAFCGFQTPLPRRGADRPADEGAAVVVGKAPGGLTLPPPPLPKSSWPTSAGLLALRWAPASADAAVKAQAGDTEAKGLVAPLPRCREPKRLARSEAAAWRLVVRSAELPVPAPCSSATADSRRRGCCFGDGCGDRRGCAGRASASIRGDGWSRFGCCGCCFDCGCC